MRGGSTYLQVLKGANTDTSVVSSPLWRQDKLEMSQLSVHFATLYPTLTHPKLDRFGPTATEQTFFDVAAFLEATWRQFLTDFADQKTRDHESIFDRLESSEDSLLKMKKEVEATLSQIKSKTDPSFLRDQLDKVVNSFHEERVKAFRRTQAEQAEHFEHSEQSEKPSAEVFYDDIRGKPESGKHQFEPEVQKALDQINDVVGQDHLKEHFLHLVHKSIKDKRLRKLDGKGVESSYHMLFRGKPGTGKTMIAGYVAKLMKALRILPSDNFKIVKLHEMKGKFMGQSPHAMNDTFRQPGVYFIDEAYSIMCRDDEQYGVEILAYLCELMENRRDEIVIIMAGYKDKIIDLFKFNSGLESRFHWIFDFEDFTAGELMLLADYAVKRINHTFEPAAREEIRKDLVGGLNGREVRNIVEEVEFCQAARTSESNEYSLEYLQTLTVDDVLKAREKRARMQKV